MVDGEGATSSRSPSIIDRLAGIWASIATGGVTEARGDNSGDVGDFDIATWPRIDRFGFC